MLKFLRMLPTTHVPNLPTVRVLLFVDSQFTTILKCPVQKSTHQRTRLIMDCGRLSGVPGLCEFFDRHQYFVGEVSHRFLYELNTLEVLNVPKYKNLAVVKMLLGCESKTV
jgi:hypothetical protein